MEGIDKTSAWEYQICSMMAEAIKTRSVQYPSIALRISVRGAQEAEDIYRIGLGRVSEFEEEYEFVFILFRVRTPFDPIGRRPRDHALSLVQLGLALSAAICRTPSPDNGGSS
jgi:hypothetical protein